MLCRSRRGLAASGTRRAMACVLLHHAARMNSSLAFLAAAISAVAAASCSGPDPTPPAGEIHLPIACSGATPSFSRDVAPLFATCAGFEGCHGRFQYDDLVNVM